MARRLAATVALVSALALASPALAAFTATTRVTARFAAAEVFAPRSQTEPAITGSAREGATLTADPGAWSGSPSRLAFQWRRCDKSGAACVDIGGATDATRVVTAADAGSRLRVRVTATNDGGSTTATSAATGVVVPRAPANTAPPSITGSATAGSTLTASPGAWSNAPTSFAYAWQRCAADCAPIAGATGSTYVATGADAGHRLRVAVTAANAGGDAVAMSAPTATITGYAAAVQASAPNAFYRFEAGAPLADATGSTGALANNGVTFGAGATAGSQAAWFDGRGAFMTLPSNPLRHRAGFTWEAWVWWDGGPLHQRLFDFNAADATAPFVFLSPASAAGRLRFNLSGGPGLHGFEFDGPFLAPGAWRHMAVTYDEAMTARLYVDGALAASASGPFTADRLPPTPRNWLGRSAYPADATLAGRLDEVATYARPLTAAEIAAHVAARLEPVGEVVARRGIRRPTTSLTGS
jgi:hypothetical protein